MGGGTANCGFALISGYLLYDKPFDKKRIIRLWMEVWFYSVFCGTLAFCLHSIRFPLNADNIFSMFFPVLTNQYWYMSTYIVIILLSPFFNKMIAAMNKREFERLILISVILYSLIPTLLKQSQWMVGTNSISILLVMYLIGAYIHRFNIHGIHNKVISAVLVLLGVISIYVRKILNLDPITSFVWGTERIIPVLLSITLFLGFLGIRPSFPMKVKKAITFFSSSVFAVYLLHIGRLREFVFLSWFNDAVAYQHGYFIGWLLGAAAIIFVVSICIDKARMLLERLIMRIHVIRRFIG